MSIFAALFLAAMMTGKAKVMTLLIDGTTCQSMRSSSGQQENARRVIDSSANKLGRGERPRSMLEMMADEGP